MQAAALQKRVHNARELERNDPVRIRQARDQWLERTGSLRELSYRYPDRARKYELAGRAIAHGTSVGFRVGLGASIACTGGWSACWNNCWWWGNGFDDCGFGWFWWWNGCHPWSSWCWWNHPCNFGLWWGWGWAPCNNWSWWYYPAYSAPIYYTTIVERYYEEPAQNQYSSAQPAYDDSQSSSGEGVIDDARERARTSTSDKRLLDSLLIPSSQSDMERAAKEYLTLGDNAFTERRYGDAVHFYAKAIEFAPNDGTYYLILSDALFATGDYHYAAYALRRALELDPTQASAPVDKHEFYKSDPQEFDRQLAVLELYVQDQPTDQDARLVLAANYLFGGRPAAAVDLLDKTESAKVRDESAGRLIYESARMLQYGKSKNEPVKK
jgi:cytochrome c-type biogenesis protein CcmH/NrfG